MECRGEGLHFGPGELVNSRNGHREGKTCTYVGGVHRIRLLLRQRRIRPMSVGSGIRRLLRGRRLVWPAGRWCGRLSAGCGLAATHELLLPLVATLVGGKGGIPGSHQGVLNRPDLLEREDGLCRDGTRHGLLPCLEHLVHFPPCPIVDLGIGTHEDRIELGAKVERIGCRNILDDRIEDVQGW